MVFLTLGTDPHPFERALDLLEPIVGREPLVVQHGHTRERDGWADTSWHSFLSYDEVVGLMRRARCVVCSAGTGAIMTALGVGARPVVIVRRASRGEHVDDHQLQIADALGALGLVSIWRDGQSATDALREEPLAQPISASSATALAAAVRKACVGARS